MTVAVNVSVVLAPDGVDVADSNTVNGVAVCTNTDVNAVPTPPLLSVAVSTTLYVPPVW
jgi:hypothetical protein